MRINTPQVHNSGMKKLRRWIILGGVLCGLHSPFTHARTTESHAGIYAAITSFVRAQVQTLGGEATIKVGEIDARLNLAACAQPEIFWPPGANMLGNSTVGVRCVRLIHGVGYGSPNGEPVLRSVVHSWLVQLDEVVAFCVASRTDGGNGALIVLLRPALDL